MLEKHGDDARAIAGGTSLLIMMRQRLLLPKVVVSLARIPKFDKITYSAKEGLRIGAGARHRDVELSPVIKQRFPLLHETFTKSPNRASATWARLAAICRRRSIDRSGRQSIALGLKSCLPAKVRGL